MNKWIGISLGTLVGVSHIGAVGLLLSKSGVPVISPPVGPYTSYVISANKEGYKISYVGNDPKTMYKTTKVKEKGGFLGLANETKEIVEEYTMDGDVHIQKRWQANGGGGDSIANNKSEACIKAIGGGENTGRLVGTSVGTAAAPALSGIPFVGWVAAGWVAMFGGNQGADIGGDMAETMSKNC
tara:strand:- start:44 stop:595 length:552 start_codon:yes stop_codon:yes gene_type:complete